MSSVYTLEASADGATKVLKFGGDLVINHIDKMVAQLRQELAEPQDLSVVVADPSNIDMTFIQLVIALKKTAAENGKKFELKTTLKDDLKELVVKAGLDKELNI